MKVICSALVAALVTTATQAPAATVNISEVFYDAVGSDDGVVFVELYGPGSQSLEGYQLQGINGSNGDVTVEMTLSGVIPDDGFFVVGDLAGTGSLVANADLLLDFDYQNGPDSVVLRDASGALVDAVGYGTFAPGDVFAGEGQSVSDPPAGWSVARVFANRDSDDNAMDFSTQETPTPGTGPVLLPEPRLLGLLALSLAGMALTRTQS